MNTATEPLWLAAEDAAARAEREAGWHWAWGETPGEKAPRAFVWTFYLAAPLHQARLSVAAQKGLPGVWLDGQLLHASQDGLAGRELKDLDLGLLPAGTHRLAVAVRTFHPFIAEPRQGGVGALLRATGADGQPVFIAPQPADWLSCQGAEAGWQAADAVLAAPIPIAR